MRTREARQRVTAGTGRAVRQSRGRKTRTPYTGGFEVFRRLRRLEGDVRAFRQVVEPPATHIVPMKRVRLPILPAERSYTMVTLQPCDLTRHVSHLVNLMVDLLEEVLNPD